MIYDIRHFAQSKWFEEIKSQLYKSRYNNKIEIWMAKYRNDGTDIFKPQRVNIRVSYISPTFTIYRIYDNCNTLLINNLESFSSEHIGWMIGENEQEITKAFNEDLFNRYITRRDKIKQLSDEMEIIKDSFYNSDLTAEILSH